MKKISITLLAIATALALAPAAMASTITAINFTCSGQSVAGPGNTTAPPAACTPMSGGYEGLGTANPAPTWYQQSLSPLTNYYTVTTAATGTTSVDGPSGTNGNFTATAPEYNENQGFNWSSLTGSHVNGVTKIPTLSAAASGITVQTKVADSTGTFDLNGFYLGENATATLGYEIFGYNGNTLVYCIDSISNSCSGSLGSDFVSLGSVTYSGSNAYYSYIANPDASTAVTSVVIDTRISSGQYQYLDNILVTQTPEPGSLFLLGTGLLGLGALVSRKRAAQQ